MRPTNGNQNKAENNIINPVVTSPGRTSKNNPPRYKLFDARTRVANRGGSPWGLTTAACIPIQYRGEPAVRTTKRGAGAGARGRIGLKFLWPGPPPSSDECIGSKGGGLCQPSGGGP